MKEQPQRDVAPVDPDARLPLAVRESLQAVDPAVVDWGTEALNEAARAALDELDRGLALGDMAAIQAVAAPGFAGRPLVLGAWEPVGAFEAASLAEAEAEVDLAAVLASWRAAAGGGSLRQTPCCGTMASSQPSCKLQPPRYVGGTQCYSWVCA